MIFVFALQISLEWGHTVRQLMLGDLGANMHEFALLAVAAVSTCLEPADEGWRHRYGATRCLFIVEAAFQPIGEGNTLHRNRNGVDNQRLVAPVWEPVKHRGIDVAMHLAAGRQSRCSLADLEHCFLISMDLIAVHTLTAAAFEEQHAQGWNDVSGKSFCMLDTVDRDVDFPAEGINDCQVAFGAWNGHGRCLSRTGS